MWQRQSHKLSFKLLEEWGKLMDGLQWMIYWGCWMRKDLHFFAAFDHVFVEFGTDGAVISEAWSDLPWKAYKTLELHHIDHHWFICIVPIHEDRTWTQLLHQPCAFYEWHRPFLNVWACGYGSWISNNLVVCQAIHVSWGPIFLVWFFHQTHVMSFTLSL